MATFEYGVPAASPALFSVEGAMMRIMPEAEAEVRRILVILDAIQGQEVDDLELLAITQVGEISISPDEHKKLDSRYLHWARALGNLLGVPPNPEDLRFGGRGINVPVRG
jgi:hypothetical protein